MILAAASPSLSTQLAAAIPLALVACVSPSAVAILIWYLGQESPRPLVLAYLAGALAISAVVATAAILVLQGTNLTPKHHPEPSAALDIALGVALLVTAVVLVRRKPAEEAPTKARRRDPRGALLLGVIMYLPSLFYIAALKQVADANAALLPTVLSGLLLVFIVTLIVEIPVGLYLLFPDGTGRQLKVFDGWIHRHRRAIVLIGLIGAGLYLLGTGIDRAVTG
jgi:threonine/homoserine/homoserine lactone efflux protein